MKLLDLLYKVRAADKVPQRGICAEMEHQQNPDPSKTRETFWALEPQRQQMKQLWKSWPHFSGDDTYPVPCDYPFPAEWECMGDIKERHDWDEDNYNPTHIPELAYEHCPHLWEGAYGAKRMELLNWMIEQLEAQDD